jgi:AbiU2
VAEQTAEEAKKGYVEKMGDPLGTQFFALWQELAILHFYWGEYVQLFGTKPTRIELMNDAAPGFFHMIQEELWESRLLHLARITDASATAGKTNLTIRNLPGLISDAAVKAKVTPLIEAALKATEFCRDWRNRHIGHKDLKLALGDPAQPLAEASRKQVKDALKSIADVMNAVELHYCDSQTAYDLGGRFTGAVALLHVLNDGVKTRDARDKRIEAGEYREEDLQRDDV